MYAPDHRVVALMEAGGTLSIDYWDLLLPQGTDPKTTSPAAVIGRAFAFGHRTNANIRYAYCPQGGEESQRGETLCALGYGAGSGPDF